MRISNLIVLFFCFILNAKSQSNIVGKVFEFSSSGDTIPIFSANVYWKNSTIGTTTDKNGVFTLRNISDDLSDIDVSYVGYNLLSTQFIDNTLFVVMQNSVDLKDVEINEKVNATQISLINPVNTQTITVKEIHKAACCNLSETFETNNSVDVTYSDAVSSMKQIKMLGLAGNYVQITSELLPLIRGMQRSYGLTYVPGAWIENIQITKGSASVVNGFESLTGQINVEYFKPEDSSDKIKLNLYASLIGKLEKNLILTKHYDKWSSNLFTHVSYFDKEIDHHGISLNSSEKGDGFIDMPKFKQFNIINRWQYNGSNKLKYEINFRGVFEERLAGQITSIDNPYKADIYNNIFQVYGKLGYIRDTAKSIGSQYSFTSHKIDAVFGNNKYDATQESISFNFISEEQTNEFNLIKYGSSYFADRYVESFTGNISKPFNNQRRVDLVSGVFLEHQYEKQKLNLISGIRSDYYNNKNKIYVLPRFNLKYSANDNTALRISAGRSFRISNIFSENLQYLASSRLIFNDYTLDPEVGWNYGLNLSHCFYFLDNEGVLNVDLYRTVFNNQIIVNLEERNALQFSNLNGVSYSNVLQIDADYNILYNLSLRLSYKLNNSISTYNNIEKELPLQPLSRALINLSYESNDEKLLFDITLNYNGKSRLPENLVSNEKFSDPFLILNNQVTYKFESFDLYLGGENITNFTQPNPIIDSENPFGNDFDAALIWAPVMGRSFYLGARCNFN